MDAVFGETYRGLCPDFPLVQTQAPQHTYSNRDTQKLHIADTGEAKTSRKEKRYNLQT